MKNVIASDSEAIHSSQLDCHVGLRPPRNDNDRGFSLLEVMVAVAILSISFMALINFQSQTTFRIVRAENITKATFLAREKMADQILNLEKEMQQQRVFPEDREENGQFEEPYERFSWEWRVRKVEIPMPESDEGGPQIAMLRMVTTNIKNLVREAKLTVKWEELGKERKIEVVTHIGKL
ncbi:MAG: prepilin-type N-terminal cleavage/methylation domain-containing protein [Deltaproteobacteria bacterium]|nr:prepilin-type N-terminal cleavage/methylation domain-containing protein [Deltaproteobacteria bacterium]